MPKPSNKKTGITIRTKFVSAKTTAEPKAEKTPAQLPFHILFVSDLTPNLDSATGASPHTLQSVDKSSFPDLLHRLAPRLKVDVANCISETPKTLELELEFPDLRSFRPEGIVTHVPALSRFLGAKLLVEKVRDGRLPLKEFKAAAETLGLQADLVDQFHRLLSARTPGARSETKQPLPPTSETGSKSADKLGSLLGMVDLGGEEKVEKRPDAMDALITAITGSETGPMSSPGGEVDRSVAETLIADLNQIMTDQVNAILHHPRFQRLESSWRGLKLLVDRMDFRKDVRLSILSTTKENLDHALSDQLLGRSGPEEFSDSPISVVVTDFEFDHSTSDIDHLGELAKTMASLQIPLIASVGPQFLGRGKSSEIAELPVLWQHFQRPEYARWNSLRDQPESNYLTLALPRFLLRYPYGSDNPVKEFDFTESAGNYLWSGAPLALAIAMARSFVDSGWPTRVTEMRDGSRIESLPVWEERRGARLPLEVGIAEDRQVELSEMGFAVLASRLNDDSAYVAFAPTIHRAEKYDDTDMNEQSRTHATLACQLMVSRILQHLLRFERELTSGFSPEAVREKLEESLRTLLTVDGTRLPKDHIDIEVSASSQQQQKLPLKIRLVSPEEILGREVTVVMGYELSRR